MCGMCCARKCSILPNCSARSPPPPPPCAGCPQLRVLKLGDCDALRNAVLRSSTLETLQLSQCRWLRGVELECPMLTQVGGGGKA